MALAMRFTGIDMCKRLVESGFNCDNKSFGEDETHWTILYQKCAITRD